MLEQEIKLTGRLNVINDDDAFESIENYSETISLIDQDKHPILHRYLSMRATKLGDSDD
jgi:hypothetical protein